MASFDIPVHLIPYFAQYVLSNNCAIINNFLVCIMLCIYTKEGLAQYVKNTDRIRIQLLFTVA